MDKDKIRELIEEKGLYDSISITVDDVDLLEKYLMEHEMVDNTIEYYCPLCETDRVFKLYKSSVHKADGIMRMSFPIYGMKQEDGPTNQERFESYQNKAFTVSYACAMNRSHVMFITLYVTENKIIKIGQFPSVADAIKPEIKKYKSLLGEERFKEYRRAVGLFASGIGIGSYVYLRRIIEGLVFDCYIKNKENLDINEDEFQKQHFDQKIVTLNSFLPQVLVENRNIYGIVSKGIHELDEEICIKMFPYIQDGIELILEQLYIENQQKEKAKNFRKFVTETASKLK